MASADSSELTVPDPLCAKCPLTAVTGPLIYGDVGVDRDGPSWQAISISFGLSSDMSLMVACEYMPGKATQKADEKAWSFVWSQDPGIAVLELINGLVCLSHTWYGQ